MGYPAGDETAKAAVLILHEWWGVKPHNRTWADKLAESGYLVMVLDLYDGRVTDDPELAANWMREIDQSARRPCQWVTTWPMDLPIPKAPATTGRPMLPLGRS